MSLSTADAFLQALSEHARSDWGKVEQLEERLSEFINAAARKWPGVSLKPDDFARHLARIYDRRRLDLEMRRSKEKANCRGGSAAAEFWTLNGPDLYLAAACVDGDQHAKSIVQQRFVDHIPKMLGSLWNKLGQATAEEVALGVGTELLVGRTGGSPGLAQYGGRCHLYAWVRTIAVREALKILKKEKTARKHSEFLYGEAETQPSLEKAQHREVVRTAFVATLGSLPQEQQTLLRLYYIDGRTMETIGEIYAVDKSTISRNLKAARDAIRHELHRYLREVLKLSTSEVDSLVETLVSQLEVSLSDALMRQ